MLPGPWTALVMVVALLGVGSATNGHRGSRTEPLSADGRQAAGYYRPRGGKCPFTLK